MAKQPRKRFNAFDDFPAGESEPVSQPQAVSSAVRVQPVNAAQVERIERLKPSQMLPDRFQPRRLLPGQLREPFFSGQANCYQVAVEWLALARADAGYRAEVDRLLAMGESFDEHGQIKPITGSWAPASDGSFIFLIETGERRFWAACLKTAARHAEEEPLLRVEVVNAPTRQRQVLENRHAEPPSAVGQACEVAALILAELGIQPQAGARDEFEFFRQARAQRMPPGLWDRLTPVMQLTRPRMVQLLNILNLPTPLLDLADRYRLPERVLREVLALPREQWEAMLKTSIASNLTAEDVAEVAGKERRGGESRSGQVPSVDPGRSAASSFRRFASLLGEMDEFGQEQVLDELADFLVVSRQAEGVMRTLEELGRLISVRIARK